MNNAWEDQPLPGLEHLGTPAVGPTTSAVSTDNNGIRVRYDEHLVPTHDDIARFNAKIVKSPTCWFWTGAISGGDGYGRFTFQHHGAQRTMLAHRFALFVSGVCLDGVVVEHRCNEPLCVRVNSGHVIASTQSHNLAYAVERGRHRGRAPGAALGADRAERSRHIRRALRDGWDETRFLVAIASSPVDRQGRLL